MLILAFESSAKAASVALVRDGALISQYSQCTALTHSRTLLPMAEDMLKNAELSMKDVDAIVEKVEKAVQSVGEDELSSRRIGEAVMDELKQLDEVAYVRFASVYRQFKDINTFRAELTKLLEDK